MSSRAYDPRRYGPTVSTGVPPAFRDVGSAAALSNAWEGREHNTNDHLQFAQSLRRGTRGKRAGVGLGTGSQRDGGHVGDGSYELALSFDDGATPKADRCGLEAYFQVRQQGEQLHIDYWHVHRSAFAVSERGDLPITSPFPAQGKHMLVARQKAVQLAKGAHAHTWEREPLVGLLHVYDDARKK